MLIKCKWLLKLIREIWVDLTQLVETDNQELLHKVDISSAAKWEEEVLTLIWAQNSTKSIRINRSLQTVICMTTVFQTVTWWETLHTGLQNITANQNTFQTSQWWTWNSQLHPMETEAVQTITIITTATFNIQRTTAICRMSLVTFKNIFDETDTINRI